VREAGARGDPAPIRRRTIRWQLGALLAAAIVPVLLALTAALGIMHTADTARQRSDLLNATRRLADVVEREIDGYIAALQGLATSDALRRQDWAAFDEQARELARRRGTAIAVRRPDGQQLVNTYAAFGTPLPVSTDPILREADKRALTTRAPAVSDLYVGAVARKAFVLAVVPVPLEGEPAHLLNLAVLPERLSEIIAHSTPEGWTATVLDTKHRIIARSTNAAAYVGLSATADQVTRLAGEEGTWYGHRIDGTPMLAAHVKLASGWTASIGVPVAMVNASTRQAWTLLVAIVVLAAVLSIGLSYRLSHRIQGQVQMLTSPAARLAGAETIVLEELHRLAQELNDRDRAIAEQLDAQAHLASIVRTSNDAIFTIRPDGTIISWNKGAEELFGYSAVEIIGSDVRRLAPADLGGEVDHKLAQVSGGKPYRADTVRQRKDGSLVDVSVNAAPLEQRDEVVAISIVAFEITERKRTERQRELLLSELDHRLKNIFATMSSLIGLSARTATDVPSYRDALRQRVYALSAVHNLVRGSGLEDSTTLHALTRTLTASGLSAGQIETRGAVVGLSASAAIAFGMILNELLTNAINHGALSRPEGRVLIEWRLDDNLRLTWSESGGPAPAPQPRPGFGTLMIEQNIRAIGGEVETEWKPGGVVVSLSCPRASLNQGEKPI
jgi:PAS domain S-box-containing protein